MGHIAVNIDILDIQYERMEFERHKKEHRRSSVTVLPIKTYNKS